MKTKRAAPPPASSPLGTASSPAIGRMVNTVVKATQQSGGAAKLGKKLADQAAQPKNPGGQ